jgi:hypothetical protein
MRKNLSQKLIEKKLNRKLIMTLLVKNEDDIVDETIKFHLNSGVDFIIATNNNSTDNTRNILLKYQERGVLELIDETAENFDQVKWVDRMIKLAINKYKADWIINVDADEFWYSRFGNLKLAMPEPNHFNAVYINCLHICSNKNDSDKFAVPLNVKGHYQNNWKCFHTAKGYKLIAGGNHDIKMKFGYKKYFATLDVFVFHFWVRSYEQYEKKVLNTFEAIEKGVRDGVHSLDFGSHIRNHYKLYQEGKLRDTYRTMVEGSSDDIVDNRLYDFIQNGYKNVDYFLSTKHHIFNNKTRYKCRNKFEKFVLSCERRINEIRKLFKKT